jgi:hypothetical protein
VYFRIRRYKSATAGKRLRRFAERRAATITMRCGSIRRAADGLSSDQGTLVTRNGGETWSSRYNQPTGQFYHVIADDRFPYWVYGAQQDSGAAATRSRSMFRSLNFHDWRPMEAGDENGYIAPDPLHPGVGTEGLSRVRILATTGATDAADACASGRVLADVGAAAGVFADRQARVVLRVAGTVSNGGRREFVAIISPIHARGSGATANWTR